MTRPGAEGAVALPGSLRRSLERLGAFFAGPLSRARPLVPRGLRERFDALVFDMRVFGLPDRIYLEQRLLPALARQGACHVLFVGTAWFTARYAAIFDRPGSLYHTLDRSPEAEGAAPGNHYVADLRDVATLFPPGSFDLAVVNGVFGFGLNTPEDMTAALRAVHRVLRPAGRLLLGWNPDRIPDPLALPGRVEAFQPTGIQGLPARARIASFDRHVHVFDLLEAVAVEGERQAS